MKILLDFDGVMVTTPTWRPVRQLKDGFMAFDHTCTHHLATILQATQADIVLTTTHRIHYDNDKWVELLSNRGIYTASVCKVNTATSFVELGVRCDEVMTWAKANPYENFVIIDDDKSLRNLPADIKERWVETSFHQGLTIEDAKQAIAILLTDPHREDDK